MDNLIDDIETAMANRLWVLALAGALALPDVCAAVESTNAKTNGNKYKAWFTRHLGARYQTLGANNCYQLRCSLLHAGHSEGDSYSRIIFNVPDAHRNVWHNVTVNDVLMLDLPTFVHDIITAVRAWQSTLSGSEPYERNMANLIRWRPEGLGNLVVGLGVLG